MSCECPNCRKDNILNGTLLDKCVVCSSELNANSKFQVMGDKTLCCDSCISIHFTACCTCDKLHPKADCRTIKKKSKNSSTNALGEKVFEMVDSSICNRCFNQYYRVCGDCNKVFERNEVLAYNEISYCKPCFSLKYKVCQCCNHTFPTEQVIYSARGRNDVCHICFGSYGPIQDYSTKAEMKFLGKPPHFYGVELEVELVNENREERGKEAHQVLELLGKDFAITKEDGSLTVGFEIVTVPAAIEEHMKRWVPFFEKRSSNLKSFNSKNCGLHIHCSKKPLSLLTIAKVVVFVNNQINSDFIETMAGRKANQFFRIAKKNYSVVKEEVSRSNRYEAVNLCNRDTIEFRIFKGTLKQESFFKAIEFCDAVIHFCMSTNHSISHCRDVNNFMKYVATNSKLYPHLDAFISAKILNKETKLTQKYGFALANPSTTINTETTPQQTPRQTVANAVTVNE